MSRTRDFSKLINGFAADKIISGTLDAARLANIDSEEGSDVSSDDNFMLFASLRVVLKTNFSMFTEIVIDDFQIEGEPMEVALKKSARFISVVVPT